MKKMVRWLGERKDGKVINKGGKVVRWLGKIFLSTYPPIHLFIYLAIFLLLSTYLYSASGRIQLSVASPDPVVAGEIITFQIIFINTGSEKWDKSEYFATAEIYDINKKYLSKTEQIKGISDILSGESTIVYIPFKVKENYIGDYLYRITLTHKEQRIITGEYISFSVSPITIAPKLPPRFQIGGNTISSYKKNKKSPGTGSYAGSLSINLIGRVYDSPISFNTYLLSKTSKGFDIDNILFNYYGKAFIISAGDIQPSYTTLVLYSAGMRGGVITVPVKRFTSSAVIANSVRKAEGTSTSNGTYSRYLWGGMAKYDLSFYSGSIDVSYVSSSDNSGSLKTPGPTLKPISNTVYGAGTKWEFIKNLGLRLEYAYSKYSSDSKDVSSMVKDTAAKAELIFSKVKNLNLTGAFSLIKPNFNSLGSPTSTKDRRTIDIITRYGLRNIGSVSIGYNRYNDNLNKDSSKVTTTQTILSGVISIQRRKFPTFSLGYSLNQSKGSLSSILNNKTSVISFGTSYSFLKFQSSIGAGAQISTFKDETKKADNLNTTSMNFNFASRVGKRFSLNFGYTLANMKNQRTEIIDKSQTLGINTNFKILIDKLTLALWGSLSTRKSPSTTSPANLSNTIINCEFTYNIFKNLAFTLGGSRNDSKDKITTGNSNIENSLNGRLSHSF